MGTSKNFNLEEKNVEVTFVITRWLDVKDKKKEDVEKAFDEAITVEDEAYGFFKNFVQA